MKGCLAGKDRWVKSHLLLKNISVDSRPFAVKKEVYMLEKELVFKITGCAMAVLNEIGHGLREKTYERALCVEFDIKNIQYKQQAIYPVIYKEVKVDEFIPDLVIEDKIIADMKTVESINDEHRGQILNYLRITGLKVGLLYNFKHSKLEWERLVLSDNNRE